MLVWDDFRVFLAIAREGTLTGAARTLGIDQSTVSRRLVALEASANARLFDRTPEGYVPNSAGSAVRERLQEIEERALEVERVLLGQDARIEGRVRIATSESFAPWFVITHLKALRARHPELVIELVTGNQQASLSRRDADVSIRLRAPAEPNLIGRKLGTVAWGLYAAETYLKERGVPKESGQLKGHDIVGHGDELAGTIGARWLREHGSAGCAVVESNSLLSQAAAVVEGLGVSTLPCVFGDTEKALRRLPPGIIGHHDIWLVVHSDVRTSARVRAVMDFFAERITEQAALLTGVAAGGRRRVASRKN
jgi:DNA-binding transcriptional LysR family regulator